MFIQKDILASPEVSKPGPKRLFGTPRKVEPVEAILSNSESEEEAKPDFVVNTPSRSSKRGGRAAATVTQSLPGTPAMSKKRPVKKATVVEVRGEYNSGVIWSILSVAIISWAAWWIWAKNRAGYCTNVAGDINQGLLYYLISNECKRVRRVQLYFRLRNSRQHD